MNSLKKSEDCFNSLQDIYHLTDVPKTEAERIIESVSDFDTFKPYEVVLASEPVALGHPELKSYLVLLSINFVFKAVRNPQHQTQIIDQEMIGIAFLKKDYGKVLIRPETFADKISELFAPTEIDFEDHPVFSKNYYMLSNEPEKLKFIITNHFLDCIEKYRGLEIEIAGNILVVRLRKNVTAENALSIAEFLSDFNDGIN